MYTCNVVKIYQRYVSIPKSTSTNHCLWNECVSANDDVSLVIVLLSPFPLFPWPVFFLLFYCGPSFHSNAHRIVCVDSILKMYTIGHLCFLSSFDSMLLHGCDFLLLLSIGPTESGVDREKTSAWRRAGQFWLIFFSGLFRCLFRSKRAVTPTENALLCVPVLEN